MDDAGALPPNPRAEDVGRAPPSPTEKRGNGELAAARAAADRVGWTMRSAQVERFARLRDLLIAGNAEMNLTAIVDPDAIEILHFVDSLAGLNALPAETGISVVDVGTGAGFPGLPMRIARPDIWLTLVDATQKKVRYLERTVAALGLADPAADRGAPVATLCGRIEAIGRERRRRASWDVALLRSVSSTAVAAEYCLPLVRVGGTVLLWKKANQAEEIATARGAIRLLGGRPPATLRVRLPGLPEDRILVRIIKEAPTPERYPRPVGVAAKQPLN